MKDDPAIHAVRDACHQSSRVRETHQVDSTFQQRKWCVSRIHLTDGSRLTSAARQDGKYQLLAGNSQQHGTHKRSHTQR